MHGIYKQKNKNKIKNNKKKRKRKYIVKLRINSLDIVCYSLLFIIWDCMF